MYYMKGGMEAMDSKIDNSISEAELMALHEEYPTLRSILGKQYILAKDKTG
jgi:hypothetical protein